MTTPPNPPSIDVNDAAQSTDAPQSQETVSKQPPKVPPKMGNRDNPAFVRPTVQQPAQTAEAAAKVATDRQKNQFDAYLGQFSSIVDNMGMPVQGLINDAAVQLSYAVSTILQSGRLDLLHDYKAFVARYYETDKHTLLLFRGLDFVRGKNAKLSDATSFLTTCMIHILDRRPDIRWDTEALRKLFGAHAEDLIIELQKMAGLNK